MKIKKNIIVGAIVLIVLLIFVNSMAAKNRFAVFDTTMGTFKIELYESKMPITTGNFIKLAESGFYDGTRFHRVIAQFMVQGGDPLSKDLSKKGLWGTGGPGYAIKDEFASGLSNAPGTIAMANSGPNTGGSQFFVNVALNNYLDGKHPVFGKVIEGYDIVQKISNTQTNDDDQPVPDVVVNKVTITKE